MQPSTLFFMLASVMSGQRHECCVQKSEVSAFGGLWLSTQTMPFSVTWHASVQVCNSAAARLHTAKITLQASFRRIPMSHQSGQQEHEATPSCLLRPTHIQQNLHAPAAQPCASPPTVSITATGWPSSSTMMKLLALWWRNVLSRSVTR